MPSKITEAEWAAAKPDIKYLYLTLNKSLKDVRTEMIRRDFEATESQYRTQFKKWGPKWIKNSKVEDTEMLSIFIEQRKSDGKESNVFEWGRLLGEEELRKRVARSTPSTLRRLELIGNQKLPAQFVIRTPAEDLTFSLTHDLPFFQFERSICDRKLASDLAPNVMVNARLLTDQQTTPANALIPRQKSIEDMSQYYSSRGSITFTTADPNALSSIIPCIIHQTTILGPPLYRQILHSACNNFSGFSSFPGGKILQILNETTNTDLYPLILSPSRNSSRYSARSIAQNLLKGAIEIGDSATAKYILSNKYLGIDVNQQFYFDSWNQYTLIERASEMGHKSLIKVLLSNGADVNKTYQGSCCEHNYPRRCRIGSHGALKRAFLGYEIGRGMASKSNRAEIIRILLDAGSIVDLDTVSTLLKLGEDDIACQIASKNLLLTDSGLVYQLRSAIEKFKKNHKDVLVRLLHILHHNGVDLTHQDIFTAVVSMDNLETSWELAKILLDYGTVPDKASLYYLIHGGRGSSKLMEAEFGFPPEECIQGLGTSVETAVQNKLCSSRSVLAYQESPRNLDVLCARWVAAVDKVDTSLIIELTEELRNLNIPITTFKFLYHALMEVSRTGDYEVASMLLNYITQLDLPIGDRLFEPALSEAIRGGNESLVHLILGFDHTDYSGVHDYHRVAATHYMLEAPTDPISLYPTEDRDISLPLSDITPQYAVMLAASLGKEAIVRILLASGQHCELSWAVKANNVWLASLLLEEYPDTPHEGDYKGFIFNEHNLEESIRHRNLDMAKLLISYGADPHISCKTIQKVQSEYRPMFELLLKANDNVRYGKGRRSMSCAFCSVIQSHDELEVKYLLDHGVDPNKLLDHGRCSKEYSYVYEMMSPFGQAIGLSQTGSLSLVELFLKAGCDPNGIVAELSSIQRRKDITKVTQKITAFLAAVGTRNIQMVDLFIQNGAIINPTITGCIRRTPLQRAAEIGSFEMVELLHNFGADINALPAVSSGATALQLAAIGGYNRIVCYLLNHKAKVDAPAAMVRGMTALEGAAFNGRTDTVHILLKAGAASHGKDRSQLDKAMKMAREEGHFPTADLIHDWPNLEDDGELRTLDDIEDDIGENEFDEFVNWDGECYA